jgi:hypothetical protein
MRYREINAVCSQIHQHINTLCGLNVELLNIKPGGTYSDRWTSENKRGQTSLIPWFSLVSPAKCWDITFNYARPAQHHSMCHALSYNHIQHKMAPSLPENGLTDSLTTRFRTVISLEHFSPLGYDAV